MIIQDELSAVNVMLTAIGEAMVDNLDEPEAKLAIQALDFTLNSLAYTTLDFPNQLAQLPREIYNYVIIRASRRLQAITIGSETLNAFSEADEMDAKRLIIRNRVFPRGLYDKVMLEFVNTYGITPSQHTSIIEQYLRTKTMYNLQSMLIDDERLRPISKDEMESAEISLITNLIVPSAIYQRSLELTKTELSIDPLIDDEDIPTEVKQYALLKAALKHQVSCISHPSKYVYDEKDMVRFKANAWQSLPKLSMLSNSNTSALVNNTTLRTATGVNDTKSTYRLKVVTDAK